ncbi:MAG: amidohydrolase family protein [Acidobacteriota bacterium]
MEILDTHQHLWDLDRLSYSWCRRTQVLNRSFTTTDYLIASSDTGVTGSIFVEADVDEPDVLAETRFALALAESDTVLSPPMLGVVAAIRPESSEFRPYLESIASHPRLKGVRRILHTEPDELSTGAQFRDNVALLEDYGLSFDLCVLARQLPLAIELVDWCPRVAFILDHVGNPPIREGNLENWRADLRQLSLRPNVSCKLSGLVTQADHQQWTAGDLRPVIEHAIECFGWDRVLFGSDWPVCTRASTLRRWVEALMELTMHCGEENQRKLFRANAARIYRC